jgi:Secretion system C-terminal sorting domain
MKRIFFILFLLSQTLNLFSQARFNRIYRLDSAQQAATTFFSSGISSNKIYLAGTSNTKLDSTGYLSYGSLTQFDITTGAVIKNNFYGRGFESTYYINDGMYMDKNAINLIGGNHDSSITFIKTNFDGDLLIRKKLYPTTFPTTQYGNPASIIKFGKGYAFTTYNAFFTNRPTKTSVVILDTLGNTTKSFDFEEGDFNCGPSELIVNKNNNITLGIKVFARKNEVDSDYVYISQLREIDSTGRTLWKYNTPANRYIFCDNFVQLANGNYLMWGSEELSTVPLQYRQVYDVQPYLAEINPQRGLIWEKRFKLSTAARLHSLKILKDSSILMAGASDDGLFLSSSAFLIRLNSRRDSVYRRNFKTPEFTPGRINYYPNQIEELTNGDLVISGYLMNNIPINQPRAGQWGWLVRTDSLGCSLELGSCRVPTKEIEKGPLSIKVFPNPVNEQMTIDYQFVKPQNNVYVEIVDIVGRAVFQKKIDNEQGQIQWQTNFVSSGLYIVSVKSDGQILWQTKISVQK